MGSEIQKIASHARSMANDKLEKSAKTYELFGRLIPQIKTPEQLEMAKNLIKQRTGMDMSSVTMEQLPLLMQQNISISDGLKMEMEERKLKASEEFNKARLGVMEQKAAKAGAAKPLTEGQAKARGFLGTMQQAEGVMAQFMKENNAPPLSKRALTIYLNSPSWMTSTLLNKQERQYIQALEQWTRAKLRKESGATIGADEIRGEMQTYIPSSDEDAQTRRQKNEARLMAQKGLRIEGAMEPDTVQGADAPADDWADVKILSEE